MSLYFETGGLLTSIQDAGRFGYQDIGVSPAGPMDRRAFYIANLLVGNPMGESALEITLSGPVIVFKAPCVIAITGADMEPILDSKNFPIYQAVAVTQGQRLKFGAAKKGLRCYFAVSGGFDIPEVMGSRSTLIRNHLGGFYGRAIKAGDRVPLRHPMQELEDMNSRVFLEKEIEDGSVEIRVIRGPQDDRFTKGGFQTFFSGDYVVTKDFDRMGIRLDGPKIEHAGDANIISDGVVNGSIQVTGNGLPIVLLADCQSTGGYTKIATAISVDLPKLAQVKQGSRIKFVEVNLKTAQKLYIQEKKALCKLENKWLTNPARS